MVIFFLCGSLEAGRDGVGDYARRLATALSQKQCTITLISLNDKFVSEPTYSKKISDFEPFAILRLPSLMPWKAKMEILQKEINQSCPAWISLQYVPFAYNDKGLPFTLAKQLKRLSFNGKWHIMFHELWVGAEDGNHLKMKILSALQQWIIKKTIKKLRPSIIHTHLPIYKTDLSRFNIEVKELALFSNIPDTSNFSAAFNKEKSVIRICFFSQVQLNEKISGYLNKFAVNAAKMEKKLEIVLMGGSKEKMENFKKELSFAGNENTFITNLGFLTPEELSMQLHSCDLGITPVSKHGIGKSGSVAAFLEHGLPIAVPVCDNDSPPFFENALNETILSVPEPEKVFAKKEAVLKNKHLINVSFIANKFLNDLITHN